MTSESREGYARLPEDLLRDLLDGAGDVANQVIDILGPALEMRERLRNEAVSLGLVQKFEGGKVLTIAGCRRRICGRAYKCGDIGLSVVLGLKVLQAKQNIGIRLNINGGKGRQA